MLLIFVILGFIAMVVLAVVLLFRLLFSSTHTFVKTPKKQVRAKILGKRSQDRLRASGVYTNYFITFELSGNDRLELPVDKKLFKEENVGKCGILTYKGELFISFEEEIEDALKEKSTVILNGAEYDGE